MKNIYQILIKVHPIISNKKINKLTNFRIHKGSDLKKLLLNVAIEFTLIFNYLPLLKELTPKCKPVLKLWKPKQSNLDIKIEVQKYQPSFFISKRCDNQGITFQQKYQNGRLWSWFLIMLNYFCLSPYQAR